MLVWKWLVIINLLTFVGFGFDKWAAKRRFWRVPEMHLMLVALAGGSPAAIAAMLLFRHKRSKTRFKLALIFVLLIQLVAFPLFILPRL